MYGWWTDDDRWGEELLMFKLANNGAWTSI